MTDARPATSDAVESGATASVRTRAGPSAGGPPRAGQRDPPRVRGADRRRARSSPSTSYVGQLRQRRPAGIDRRDPRHRHDVRHPDRRHRPVGRLDPRHRRPSASHRCSPAACRGRWRSLLALGVGASSASINGLGITRGGIQPFIMTLGMLVIARGVTLTYSDGKPIRVGEAAADIAWIGTGTMRRPAGPVRAVHGHRRASPGSSCSYTTFGRQVYAVGDNLEAARLSGIPTRRVIFSVYVISGLCAAVSALIVVARLDGRRSRARARASSSTRSRSSSSAGPACSAASGGIGGTVIGAGIVAGDQQPAQPARRVRRSRSRSRRA